jgi:GTPase SAR1 family protein
MNLVLALRPEDVEAYLVTALTAMIESGDFEPASSAPPPASPAPEPSVPETVPKAEPEPVAAMPKLPPALTILTLGSESSGKTSFLKSIQGDATPKTQPTVGFTPVTLGMGNSKITFFDLSGSMPELWSEYYAESYGCIYVLDASTSDMKFGADVKLFTEVASSPKMSGKPCLVLLSHPDLPSSRTPEEVVEDYPVFSSHLLLPAICNGKFNDNTLDPRLESALSAYFNVLSPLCDELDARVIGDKEEQKKKDEEEKMKKDRRVMKKSLSKALGGEESWLSAREE